MQTNKGLFGRGAIILCTIALIIALVSAAMFWYLFAEIDRETLHEKLIAVERELNVIVGDIQYEVDKDADWNQYDYDSKVSNSMSEIDSHHMTFACAYKRIGTQYENISARTPSYEDSPFDPFASKDFVAAIKERTEGTVIIPFTPTGAKQRDMYTHFRVVPNPEQVADPYLLVIAVSKYSVTAEAAGWLSYMAAFIVILIMLIPAAFIAYAKRVTHGKDGRRDDTR
jgi:hypothetical protein